MAERVYFPGPGAYCSIGPLYNFSGPFEPIELGPGVVIRPFADTEREALVATFGAGDSGGSFSADDLDDWSHVVECRWPTTQKHDPNCLQLGADAVRDVVRALRLHHPGKAGTKIVWARPEPDGVSAAALSPVAGSGDMYSEPATRIRPDDKEALATLLRGIQAAQEDRRVALALRRFDAAYSRDEDEDRLIDLWIAFEAIVLPDGRSELSYRAALRIAQLAGDGPNRRDAFQQARDSYGYRSQVVHGEAVVGALEEVVEETRELARKVLRAWIMEPPPGGIEEVDRSLFA